MKSGDWAFSIEHQELCQIIDVQELWDQVVCKVWLPTQNIVERIRADRLSSTMDSGFSHPANLTYITAASRVAHTLTQNVLLAPIEASVIPLPHQIWALSRATTSDRIRYLLADEVGLGKTIEAGLIMRELKLRGLVRRSLVIAPRGLVMQWVSEMYTHFQEVFYPLIPGDFISSPSAILNENRWKAYDQVVCPMDSVKPLDKRRGWLKEQVAEYNRERFEDLIAAGWDLVIVDEAHRLAGSTEQVARYKLAQGLAETTPYLLLLSATPHQGKSDAFHRLISLLDPEAFLDANSLTRERVQPYIIRTEKRRAIDAQGHPLFKQRHTQLVPIAWKDHHHEQRLLYDAVTEYVKEGYNQAIKEKKNYVGFLMNLMQRLVTSSTQAIRTTLERRLEVLRTPEEQVTLFSMLSEDDWSDLDGQEQVDTLFKTYISALKNERLEVESLLETTKRAGLAGPDAKAEALLDWIYRLQQEETDPYLKILIFTEFVPTQEMLQNFLNDRAFSVTVLNGSMSMEERKRSQEAFATEAQILISTEAGGEGLNLQFAHVVINYDIPWNPMRLEQRIGRVDRIGQSHPVQAINFALEDTVEYRVREVLEAKLAIIFKEFGVDKAGDVLDSAQVGQIFDDLYVETILHPEKLDTNVESLVKQVQEQVKDALETASVLQSDKTLDPTEAQRLLDHPLSYWIERMVITYLEAYGGTVKREGQTWDLTWPTGEKTKGVVFSSRDVDTTPSAFHLTLEDSRLQDLVTHLPRFAKGQPVSCITLPGIPPDVQGFWSLWRIAIDVADWKRQRIMPLFLHDNGRVLLPTARHIWEQLISDQIHLHNHLIGQDAVLAFERLWKAAEIQGKPMYEELHQSHLKRLAQEREKGERAFLARRQAVERIGLSTVRTHRTTQLLQEERSWREQLASKARVVPDIHPLIIIRIEGERVHHQNI
jgi:superfamily II DNA or RNA helicase